MVRSNIKINIQHKNIESKRSVFDTCDPAYLRELREAAGMDLTVLARTACLSVAQVRELETDDSDNLFYSDAIKRQAYKTTCISRRICANPNITAAVDAHGF